MFGVFFFKQKTAYEMRISDLSSDVCSSDLSLAIDGKAGVMRVAGREVREGDVITIDGASGEVMMGRVPTVQPELAGDFGTLMVWADKVRRLKVRANAETPPDGGTPRDFGAGGIDRKGVR